MMLDRKEQASFTFEDIYDAVDKRELVELLWKKIDDSGAIELWARDPSHKKEVETALGDAAEALRGREMRKVGVGENPLCLVMAIVLQAIQNQYGRK